MNMTNVTTPAPSSSGGFPPMLMFFISLQQTVFISACVGNGLVIFVFTKYLKFKSNTNKFIVSLSVADSFTGIASGIQVFYFLYPNIATDKYVCFLRYNIISYMTLTSQLTVMLATLDRYVAICHPHKYSKFINETTSNVMCILPWLLAIFDLLSFLGWNNWLPGMSCVYGLLFSKLWYGTTCVIIYTISAMTFLMYLSILKTAWRYHNKIKPQQTDHQNQMKTKAMEKDIRSAKVTGVVALVFSLCWLPYKAIQLRDAVSGERRSPLLNEIGNWLVFLGIFNSVVNPFIYGWKRPDFKRQCKKIFSCSHS